MEYNFKVGDRIRILEPPTKWASSGGRSPMQVNGVKYPLEGLITGISECFRSFSVDQYGFSLEYIPKYEILTQYYEIF